MNERDEAPLDSLSALLQRKWKETKDWLHDICIEDGKTSSHMRNRKTDKVDDNTSAVQQPDGQQVICMSGYEELNQRASISAPQSQDNVRTGVDAGKTDISSDRHAEAQLHSLNEQKSLAATKKQQMDFGPSVDRDAQRMWQKGDIIEVYSISKKCWFEGVVIEAFAVDGEVDGCKIPNGSYMVHYSETTMKWIWPENVQELLRPPSRMSGI